MKIYEKILDHSYASNKLESFNRLTQIMNEIKNYNPNYKTDILQDTKHKEARMRFHDGFIDAFFSKDFLKFDRVKMQNQILPRVIVTKENNEITASRINELPNTKVILAYVNLLLIHAQDCIINRQNIECFLCKVGFCGIPENSEISKKLHDTLDDAKILLPELIIKK